MMRFAGRKFAPPVDEGGIRLVAVEAGKIAFARDASPALDPRGPLAPPGREASIPGPGRVYIS